MAKIDIPMRMTLPRLCRKGRWRLTVDKAHPGFEVESGPVSETFRGYLYGVGNESGDGWYPYREGTTWYTCG